MSFRPNEIPLINLVGDELENIYQLGLKDRERHKALFDQVHHFLSTPYPAIDRAAGKMANYLINYNLERNDQFKRRLAVYAEGLERTLNEVAYATMIPELVSCLTKWLPGLPSGIMGCSSYFHLDEKSGGPLHGRILDFPLNGSFDVGERALLTQFSGLPQVFSFGSCGMPFHAISGMNEGGMTLALHQKFTDVFVPQGSSVFEIAHNLLHSCSTAKEALSFLKKQTSITTWCFLMSFSESNEVLVVDLMGDQLAHRKIMLTPGEVLYFNNQLLQKKMSLKASLPLGITEYNKLRQINAEKKIKHYKSKGKFNSIELVKLISTPLQSLSRDEVKNEFDSLTLSSLQAIVMSPKAQEVTYIPGRGPKLFKGEIGTISALFDRPKHTLKTYRGKKTSDNYIRGLTHYAHAQSAIDSHQLHEAYHHLQMGMTYFASGPLYEYGRFFFNVMEFMTEDQNLLRSRQLKEFLEMRQTLSPYMSDLATLYANRLERVLGRPSRFSAKDINDPSLKKVFRLEQKIPTAILFKSVTLIMAPRLDIRDVVQGGLRP